jgi:hypothetical protein
MPFIFQSFSKLYHFVCMMKFIFSTARKERYGWDAGTGVYLYCVVIELSLSAGLPYAYSCF